VVLPLGEPYRTEDRRWSAERFRAGIAAFLWGDERYRVEREQLTTQATGFIASAAIARAIAPYVGHAAPILGPAVVLALIAVSKMGLNAWCAAWREGPGGSG
jgi:hypothetical protein